MNRIELSLRRIYYLDDGAVKKVALSINFWNDLLKEDFKQFVVDNNLLPTLNDVFLDTMFNNGFLPVLEDELINFLNFITRLYKDKCMFLISRSGFVPVQLSYVKQVVVNLASLDFYDESILDNDSSPLDSDRQVHFENEENVKEYINGLIKILSLYV